MSPSSLPALEAFHEGRVLWRPSPATRDVIKTTLSSSPEPSSLPLNATSPVVEFRSELFEGWAALWVAGLPGRSAGGSEARLEVWRANHLRSSHDPAA